MRILMGLLGVIFGASVVLADAPPFGPGFAVVNNQIVPSGIPSSGLTVVNVISQGTDDTISDILAALTIQKWSSPAASPKTQYIPSCTPAIRGSMIMVKDWAGSARVYPLTVRPASGTIDGYLQYTLADNMAAIHLVCAEGAWFVE